MSSDALFAGLQADHGSKADAAKADKRIADAIRGSLFPKQLNVLEDASRIKSVICPRRAGKSWTALSYVHDVCLRKPGAVCVIVCLVLKSAKTIYWNEVQPRFHRTFGIRPAAVHHTDMRVTLSNGSYYFYVGAETKAEVEKLRGGSYDLVIVDEAKSYPPDTLRELLFDVVEPGCSDRRGTMMMIGTPGSIPEGPFFEGTFPNVLKPKNRAGVERPFSRTYDDPEPYWKTNPADHSWTYSRHSWTVQDNVALPHLWPEALAKKEREGWGDDHPTWCSEYLAKWVTSTDAFVYAYASLSRTDPNRVQWRPSFQPGAQGVNSGNGIKHGLPPGTDYRYVVGMDLGYEDDFALVVGAYDLESGILYHVYDFKLNHQDVYQVADHLSRAIERFDGRIDAAVADNVGSGKMVIETLNRRHGFNIQPAEKREKFDFIELMNADFHSGKVKLIPGSDLDLEMRMLQFDLGKGSKELLARTGRLREHPGLPNHLCDAWLYLWRYSYHTYATPAVRGPAPGSDDWFRAAERASIEALVEQRDADRRGDLTSILQSRSYDPLAQFRKIR